MNTRLQALLLVSPLCLHIVACGDDDNERSTPNYVSGVESTDAPVADLSTEEKQQICETYDRHVDAYVDLDQVVDILCLPRAILFSGGTRQGCEQELAKCRAEQVSPIVVQGTVTSRDTCLSRIDRCDQTVAEFEGCVNVNIGAVVDILDRLTCASAENDDQRQQAESLQTAGVCANSNANCGDYVEIY